MDKQNSVFDDEFRQKIEELGFPGGIFAVLSNDTIITKMVFGYTDVTRSKKVDENSLFCLQSTTKTLTAIAFLITQELGLVDLDDPIYTYLDDLYFKHEMNPDAYKKITFRHLLSHTSGLVSEGRKGGVFNCESVTFEEHVRSCFGTYLIADPGSQFNYSNIGMDLVVYAIEKITNQNYSEFIRQHLCDHLGISILFDVPSIYQTKNAARGSYSGVLAAKVDGLAYGCGGAFLSINDHIRYVQFLLNRGENLITTQNFNEALEINGEVGYGLGIMKAKFGDLALYNHPGGGFGLTSELFWSFDENLAMVGLTNDEDVAFEVKGLLINVFKKIMEDRGKTIRSTGIVARTEKTYHNLDILEGVYIGDWGTREVKIHENTLLINNVEYKAHDNWIFSSHNGNVRFEVIENEVKAVYAYHDMVGLMQFVYFGEIPEINYEFKDHWREYEGLYQFDLYCTDTLYQSVVEEKGKLILYGDRPMELIPISDNVFKIFTGEAVVFEKNYMYNTTNTKCMRKDDIVEELTALRKKDSSHRHLTPWMLDMCAAHLKNLGREDEATQVVSLKLK